MSEPINYPYLSGALRATMQWIPAELVAAGLLKQKDLEKAEELVAAAIKRCEERERAFSNDPYFKTN